MHCDMNKNIPDNLLLICPDVQHAMNQGGPSGFADDHHKPLHLQWKQSYAESGDNEGGK